MYIKKIKFIDNQIDPLQLTIGKRLIKRNTQSSGQEGGQSSKLAEDNKATKTKLFYHGKKYRNTTEGLYEIVQPIRIKDDIELSNSVISNHLSEIVVPVHINEVAVNDDTKAVSSAYVKAKFNFVSEQYEHFTSTTHEAQLPCIYLENDPQQTKTIMDQKVFQRVIPKARGFYDFGYILKPRYKEPDLSRVRTLMFGQNFSFNIGNSEREQYPFYNNIRFNYHTSNDFKNALKQFNFFEHFLDDYINSSKVYKQFKTQTTQFGSKVKNETYTSFDITEWLEKSDFSFSETDKLIFEPTQKYKSSYQYYLDKLAFVGKIRKLCRSKMRDIQEIHNNKHCETETLFYKIEKFANDSSLIQTYWIPADDDYIDYVDTQIKYGVKYTYKVSAYVLVFGSTYRYVNRRKVGTQYLVDAVVKPSFKIMEIKNIFSDYCKVVQPPQPVPNIMFVNESSKEDYIKIHLNLAINSEDLPLKPIITNDLEQELLRLEYDRLKERPRFVYNNERALYEIYRTDFIPERYEDLQGHKIAEIRNSFPSTGAVFKDYIQPWKNYYYVFRSVNFHGLVSNPTPVYEVKMTKDADESFLNVQTVPFFIPNISQPVRTFMRLLQAIPATQHTFYDEANMLAGLGEDAKSLKGANIDKLTLGGAKHPIWGNKFKFRITSSETGKKIDFNINVNLIKKKTKENSK